MPSRTYLLISFVVFACFYPVNVVGYDFPYTSFLKSQFESLFQEKCVMKHPTLVNRFVQSLENPADRYLTFVFQQYNVSNGGLGDRMAGIISAVSMALRLNRTLLIRDTSGLPEFFRPYHPVDMKRSEPKYTWSHFSDNNSISGSNETELNIDCHNHEVYHIPTSYCSLAPKDASQQRVVIVCNRVYICFFENPNNTVAHAQWRNLEITEKDDLNEIAGCMLRLALWPTEALWASVDQTYYHDIYKDLFRRNISLSPYFTNLGYNFQQLRADLTNYTYSRRQKSITSPPDFEQIGVHFRCGDDGYLGSKVKTYNCRYEPEHPSDSSYMSAGNPYQLGLCARQVLRAVTKPRTNERQLLLSGNKRHKRNRPRTSRFVLLVIASDSELSSNQIRDVTSYSHTLLFPSGCHVDLTPTRQCLSFTLTNWFIMSLSRHLVTQALDYIFAPHSSFSRYAGIYGLQDDSFRLGKYCNGTVNSYEVSRTHYHNWACL